MRIAVIGRVVEHVGMSGITLGYRLVNIDTGEVFDRTEYDISMMGNTVGIELTNIKVTNRGIVGREIPLSKLPEVDAYGRFQKDAIIVLGKSHDKNLYLVSNASGTMKVYLTLNKLREYNSILVNATIKGNKIELKGNKHAYLPENSMPLV